MSYLGLAEVFNGKTGVEVSASSVNIDMEGVRLFERSRLLMPGTGPLTS